MVAGKFLTGTNLIWNRKWNNYCEFSLDKNKELLAIH